MRTGSLKDRVPTRVRVRLSGFLRRALALLPRGAYEPLRRAYFNAPAASIRRRGLRPVMSLVRLREVTGVSEFAIPDAPQLRLANADSQIVQLVYWLGQEGYEPGEAGWWRRACSRAQRILEVGANIGYYTVQGASAAPTTPYTAVDPLPVNVEALHKNVRLNALSKVEIVEAAVVGEDGPATVELMLPDLHFHAASAGAYVAGAAVGDRPASRSVTVPTVAMRDLIAGVDLIKIDIEGYEHLVLSSVRDVLAASKPVLFIEVLDHAGDLRELLAELVENDGYGIWALVGAHCVPVDLRELRMHGVKRAYGTRDVVLAPEAAARDLGLDGV